MTEGTELAPRGPQELMRQATDVAGVCKEIVAKTAKKIQGRKYVCVEGWSAIAIAHGCTLSARDVEQQETGIRAVGEVRRMSDGIVLATAEGFVGNDESTWNKRPEYARRAMAQTRAMSRAARTAFAHVVVMIDGEMSTTPAEEVPHEEEREVNAPPKQELKPLDKLKHNLGRAGKDKNRIGEVSVSWQRALDEGIVNVAEHSAGKKMIEEALKEAAA